MPLPSIMIQFAPWRRWTSSLLLLVGSFSVCLDGIELADRHWGDPTEVGEASDPNRPDLIELPRDEYARRMWLLIEGKKYGLTVDSDVEVVCTCTCCGDRCTMGAACCCSAVKHPVARPEGACRLIGPCGTGGAAAIQPEIAFKAYPLPDPVRGPEILSRQLAMAVSDQHPTEWLPEPPQPVPRSLSV